MTKRMRSHLTIWARKKILDAKERIERCAPEALNFDASAKYNGSRPDYVFRSGDVGPIALS